MILQMYTEKHRMAESENWKSSLLSAIKNFATKYKVMPSYITANSATHALLDSWVKQSRGEGQGQASRFTHFIFNGKYIHLVFDNQIKDQLYSLEYDPFFEIEGNCPQLPSLRRSKKKVAKGKAVIQKGSLFV